VRVVHLALDPGEDAVDLLACAGSRRQGPETATAKSNPLVAENEARVGDGPTKPKKSKKKRPRRGLEEEPSRTRVSRPPDVLLVVGAPAQAVQAAAVAEGRAESLGEVTQDETRGGKPSGGRLAVATCRVAPKGWAVASAGAAFAAVQQAHLKGRLLPALDGLFKGAPKVQVCQRLADGQGDLGGGTLLVLDGDIKGSMSPEKKRKRKELAERGLYQKASNERSSSKKNKNKKRKNPEKKLEKGGNKEKQSNRRKPAIN